MKTTQVKRSVSEGADVKPYGWAAGRPPKYFGAQGGPRELCNIWLMKFYLVADRNRSSERWFITARGGTASWPPAPHRYKPWAKPEGTLSSTEKNLGAISQRGQHLISFKHTTSTCSQELAKAGRVFLKAALSGPIHPPPKLWFGVLH